MFSQPTPVTQSGMMRKYLAEPLCSLPQLIYTLLNIRGAPAMCQAWFSGLKVKQWITLGFCLRGAAVYGGFGLPVSTARMLPKWAFDYWESEWVQIFLLWSCSHLLFCLGNPHSPIIPYINYFGAKLDYFAKGIQNTKILPALCISQWNEFFLEKCNIYPFYCCLQMSSE